MGFISRFFKHKDWFSPQEQEAILEAVKAAEIRTSGEIRVFVESRCRFVDPLDRAMEVFKALKMEQTAERNAVLVYIAMKDRQLAIYGDEGIHQKVGSEFWQNEVKKMLTFFTGHHYAQGIVTIVHEIGEVLQRCFPYNAGTDKNELPDEIVFGK